GIARLDRIPERRIDDHMLLDRDPHRTRRTILQPDLVPGPPQDKARARGGRARALMVILAEVRPPGEDLVPRERRLAIQAELHSTGTRRAPMDEPLGLTCLRLTPAGRWDQHAA